MRSAECVHDEYVEVLDELLRELHVVLFLFRMEADVFEQEHFSVFPVRDGFVDLLADAVGDEAHGPSCQLRELFADGLERVFEVDRSLRAAEVRDERDFSARVAQSRQRRKMRLYARVVADPAVGQGDVEVHPDQNLFTRYVRGRKGLEAHSVTVLF